MEKNQTIAIAAVAVLLVAGISAFILLNSDSEESTGEFIDARGRTVNVPGEIDSIYAIKSCSLELVSFFNAVNKVTFLDSNEVFNSGRTHNIMLNSLLKDLPTLNASSKETVAMKDIDVIISSTVDVTALNAEQSDYGKPVFAINADLEFDSPEFFDQLNLLGKLFKEEARATELVNGIKGFINDVKIPGTGSQKTGYYAGMMYYGGGQFYKASGNFVAFDYLNVRNIVSPAGNKQPYVVNKETILSQHMDYIFLDGTTVDACKTTMLADATALEVNTPEFRNVTYKLLVYKDWGTNWQNVLINTYYVSKVTTGAAWDFEAKANAILDLFYPDSTVDYAGLVAKLTGGGCAKVSFT